MRRCTGQLGTCDAPAAAERRVRGATASIAARATSVMPICAAAAMDAVPRHPDEQPCGLSLHGVRRGESDRAAIHHTARRGGCRGTHVQRGTIACIVALLFASAGRASAQSVWELTP
ncbi:MAG TPA: hypothetical protein VJ783_30285, partial [Pirellulales bacterium]|nr:hypothetical protein [Pirellulales bacterium]